MAKQTDDIQVASEDSKVPQSFYSFLLVYKSRRFFLFTACGIALAFSALIINDATMSGRGWHDYILVVAGICATLILVPRSEEWQYQPWQSRPQRTEKIIFD